MARRSSGAGVAMPADRLFHARLGHSAKVSSLSDLAYRVWTTYMLAADDFGVMRADAVAFQAAHDALSTRPAGEVAAGIERIREVGLVETFEHQGARYLFQADWQDFQRVRFPTRTLHPLPASAKVSARTHHLWSAHPGGTQVPAPPKNFGTTSAQSWKSFRRSAEELPHNSRSASAQIPDNIGSGAALRLGLSEPGLESLPHNSGTTSEALPEKSRTTSEELPSHARACETANGLWLTADRGEGGSGGEGSKRAAKASRRGRGGGARSTESPEAYDAVIERAKP